MAYKINQWLKMCRIRISLFLLLTSAILVSCGTVEKRYVSQGTLSEDISSIVETPYSESTSGSIRSDIWKLDDEFVGVYGGLFNPFTIESYGDRYKLFISPGKHKIIVRCSKRGLSDYKFLSVKFDAIKGHDYAAKCRNIVEYGMFYLWIEKDIGWVEIVDLDTNEVVAKSNKCVWYDDSCDG